MEIKNENLMAAYNAADESGKQMLRTLFPDMEWNTKTEDNHPIMERVKTFEDAINELGENHPLVLQFNTLRDYGANGVDCADLGAYLKLRIIAAALNEGWTPKFTEDEWRWSPWFTLWTEDELADKSEEWKQDRCLQSTGEYVSDYCGFACASSAVAPSLTTARFGSLLCFRDSDLAIYAGKQFIKLWMDFYLIRK